MSGRRLRRRGERSVDALPVTRRRHARAITPHSSVTRPRPSASPQVTLREDPQPPAGERCEGTRRHPPAPPAIWTQATAPPQHTRDCLCFGFGIWGLGFGVQVSGFLDPSHRLPHTHTLLALHHCPPQHATTHAPLPPTTFDHHRPPPLTTTAHHIRPPPPTAPPQRQR